MKYLLDTNVISEINKPNCNQNVSAFIKTVSMKEIYLSAITIGELYYGIEKLPVSKKKHDLSVWLFSNILPWFDERIIILDTDVLIEWGKLRAKSERTLPVEDTFVAACAIVHNMFLVTRNTKDFYDIEGIKLLNPWEV
ncbi:MAG: type II toxin-antitoxin system VapC family toxin [Treponema sp.]|nr:type II toxin-antitoxin system VapC family toxin [Treponema sp.]